MLLMILQATQLTELPEHLSSAYGVNRTRIMYLGINS